MRPLVDYAARTPFRETPTGYDVDTPTAGFYRVRLRRGARFCGVRIWFGPPLDPVTGEEMDRSHRWQAQVDGKYIELDQVWPKCAREPINEEEANYLKSLREWGEANAPGSPQADPTKAVNPFTAPLPF